MINSIRRKIPKPLKIFAKSILNFFTTSFNYFKRKIRKRYQPFSHIAAENYNFAILCIKKTIYAKMVIENINSLHYLNPNHKITLYCDTLCAEYLQAKKNKFNYLSMVDIKNTCNDADKPWQYYKVDTLIQASKHDGILIDADSIWHDNPLIDREKITFLVMAYKIKENKNEKFIAEKVLGKPEWVEFNHYVTGFVSIPSRFMTDKLAQDMRDYNDIIFRHPLDFVIEKNAWNGLRRLSEELAVNIAVQSNYPSELITIINTIDGPENKKLLQPLYYGCLNQINE